MNLDHRHVKLDFNEIRLNNIQDVFGWVQEKPSTLL